MLRRSETQRSKFVDNVERLRKRTLEIVQVLSRIHQMYWYEKTVFPLVKEEIYRLKLTVRTSEFSHGVPVPRHNVLAVFGRSFVRHAR